MLKKCTVIPCIYLIIFVSKLFSADAIMNGALARVMFDTAMEKLESCRFLCTALRIALNFEFPTELQKLIKRSVSSNVS
jgi:hypothetical protein